jgi:DNA invertase Pin-like site-specific DNA recombinase
MTTQPRPLLRAIRAGVAEMESRVIGQRTRAGLRAVAESGRPAGGQPPLGYRAVGEKRERRWIIDPGEAETVRRKCSFRAAARLASSSAAYAARRFALISVWCSVRHFADASL